MQPQVCVCGSLFQRLLNSYHFLCFHSLTSCCFQIVVKPLSLLPTYFGGNKSNSAWLLSCVQTGGDLPRAQMIPISWFWLPIFGSKLWNVRYQLSIPLLRFHFSLVLYTFHLVTSAAVHWTLNCGNRIGVYFLKVFLSWSIPQGNFWNNPERIPTFFCVCAQSHFPCCRDTCLHISDTVLLMIISKQASVLHWSPMFLSYR